MAIRAGQILHAMNQFIVDRIQTGGAGNLNIPQNRVYELGNYQSVGIVRDVPDLSFTLDVLDVGTQVEALVTGAVRPDNDTDHPLGDGTTPGASYDLSLAIPADIISPFKTDQGAYSVVKGVAVPQLSLEQVQYTYGLTANAGENWTLRGDSIYYIPGVPFLAVYAGDGTTTTFVFQTADATPVALHALLYTEQGQNQYALNVSVNGKRQRRDVDFTDTNTHVVFTTAPANGAVIRITFGANENAASAPITATYSQSVHSDLSVKPAAIRGRDIRVKIGGLNISHKWHDVQSFQANWRVTLDNDYEFGDAHAVNRDFIDPPDVSGTIGLKAITVAALFDKLFQITGVPTTDVIGPQSSVTVPIIVELLNPASGGTSHVAQGAVLKTLFIPDARFTIPGYEGRVSQKLTSDVAYTSDKGLLYVIKGQATLAQLQAFSGSSNTIVPD
jgi:hypothetical protein